MARIGYARVSTINQDLNGQVARLIAANSASHEYALTGRCSKRSISPTAAAADNYFRCDVAAACTCEAVSRGDDWQAVFNLHHRDLSL